MFQLPLQLNVFLGAAHNCLLEFILIADSVLGEPLDFPQNHLFRRFIPKGKRISDYSDDDILAVELWANSLPRKILGYKTPDEAFEAEMDAIYSA